MTETFGHFYPCSVFLWEKSVHFNRIPCDCFFLRIGGKISKQVQVSLTNLVHWPTEIKWKWRDIQPSMVTHTQNSCSACNPSKVNTHRSEHTPGAVGSRLCCGARGSVGGSVPCSRAPQSWYWGWSECWTFTPSTYNSCRPETRTRNLSITSPTL